MPAEVIDDESQDVWPLRLNQLRERPHHALMIASLWPPTPYFPGLDRQEPSESTRLLVIRRTARHIEYKPSRVPHPKTHGSLSCPDYREPFLSPFDLCNGYTPWLALPSIVRLQAG